MKIAFIIPSLGFGGAERVISVLANNFVKNNEVYILTTNAPKDIAYVIDTRVKNINVHQKSVFKTWLGVRRVCNEKKIDVAIAFMSDIGIISAVFLAFSRTKLVVSERNDPFIDKKKNSKKIKLLEKLSRLFIDGYVFQSNGAKQYYPQKCQKKSRVILNPIDLDKLPERNTDIIDNRIVSVGRLQKQKNQKMLIEAFALTKAKEMYTLHIYGEGPLRSELTDQIEKLGLKDRVFLEGNSTKVLDDIKNASLFAFTSDYEGLPNALIEAMAIGIPCVSTDCSPGGARMLINDGQNGRLIECNNEVAFARAIDETLFDDEVLKLYSTNCVKIRDLVGVEKISKEWIEFIGDVFAT